MGEIISILFSQDNENAMKVTIGSFCLFKLSCLHRPSPHITVLDLSDMRQLCSLSFQAIFNHMLQAEIGQHLLQALRNEGFKFRAERALQSRCILSRDQK